MTKEQLLITVVELRTQIETLTRRVEVLESRKEQDRRNPNFPYSPIAIC